MANTKKFNEQEVLLAAQQVFWRNGFSATSTRELQQATKLKPGSLYSSFGNKEALYQKTLEKYLNDTTAMLEKFTIDSSSDLVGLRKFILSQFNEYNLECGQQQCMLIKTISELPDHPALINTAKQYLKLIEKKFSAVIEQSIKAGDTGKVHSGTGVDLTTLSARYAKQLQVLVIGLRQYYSATEDLSFVHSEINRFFDNLY